MAAWLARAADLIWSYPVVGLCLLSALFFTVRLGFVQLRALPHAIALLLGRYDRDDETGTISHFQALSAALSGTVGIGNIAGVAIAIAVGGPGSVLWMWIIGLFGMATKFVECTLGTKYRTVDPVSGEPRGGPMHYIVAGLGPKWRPVAVFYAVTIAFAGFGFTCMFQSNQAADALRVHFAVPTWVTGAALATLTGLVILGGIRSIGKFAAAVVPTMCLIYVCGSLVICALHLDLVPTVIGIIVRDGLTGEAAAGGAVGSMILWGVRRAIFSNEAGLGSASIAHAAVKTDEPVREGIVASLGPLIDTIIVSGATAVVVVLAGNYGDLEAQPVESLDPVELASGWERVAPSAVPDENAPTTRHVDGAPVFRGAGAETLLFEVDARALARDGVRIAGRVESGTLVAKLRAGEDELGSVTLRAGDPRWAAETIELDEDLRAAVDGRAVVLELRAGGSAFVVAPTLVDDLTGISLSAASFDRFIPGFGSIFISIAGFCFALSTMITWSYYGETASAWVFGDVAVTPYRLAFVALAFVGAVYELGVVISFSDALVGLLVVPNVIALVLLSPRVAGWSRDYFARLRAGEFDRH